MSHAIAKAVPFYPAALFYPIWLFSLARMDRADTAFAENWPLAVCMVFGSMIAGATPLGGGVVAFPISVLILKLSPSQSRDISILLQSVGMSAASFLLLTTRPGQVDRDLVMSFLMFGTIGCIIGFSIDVAPRIATFTYTTIVLHFSIFLKLRDFRVTSPSRTQSSPARRNSWLALCALATCAILGGILSATIGSGIDMAVMVYGTICNTMMHEYDTLTLVSSSVVAMASISVVCTIIRFTYEPTFDRRTIDAWFATVWIVILGAPVGSLLLTPLFKKWLLGAFYVLSVVQFTTFAVLKIEGDTILWIAFSAVSVANALCNRVAIWRHMTHIFVSFRPNEQVVSTHAGDGDVVRMEIGNESCT